MKPCNTVGLSILASGLSFVGAANATDIVVDGSYESATNNYVTDIIGNGGNDAAGIDGGWTHFSTYNYSAGYTQAGPAGSGSVYLRPYPSSGGSQEVSQTNTLTRAISAAQIDGATGQYTFSARFSTYLDQNDYSDLTLQFLDASQANIGSPVALGGAAFVAALPGGTGLRAWGQDSKTGLIPSGARYAAITSVSHALAGEPDGYVDLVSLDVTVGAVPISIASVRPANNAINVSPGVIASVVLQDGTLILDTNSIQLGFDGSPVSPSIQKAGNLTTVQYDPAGLLAPLSTHNYKIAFNNTGGSTPNTTNEFSFTVLRYYDILLPSPIYLETFDSTPEGMLPAGWTSFGFSGQTDPECNPLAGEAGGLQDLHSACYTNWVVVNGARFNSNMLTYPTHDPTTDYQRVLSINHANVVNGAIVENLAQGNIAFGNSGYQDGNGSQVVYLFSPDFDLTGKTNVYLSFHSLWEQNQDSIGALEYSIDEGATWLPLIYYIDGPDIVRDGQGNIDAVATLSRIEPDGTATYFDPIDGQTKGGYYGAFIGVASNEWASLGPYFSARVNDNPVESKRVEIFRLPLADNRPRVRFRFAHAGTDSWYFGLDNVGLYSISVINPPSVVVQPRNQVEAVGNTVLFQADVFGLGPFTFQWQRDDVNLADQTNSTLAVTNLQMSHAGNYSLVVGYPGGATSGPPAVLMVIEPAQALVTGQWDFENFDLSATCGHSLEFSDSAVEFDTGFSGSDFYGIPGIDGQPVPVMNFPGLPSGGGAMNGYRMRHGIPPNGGGTNVNQYTLIMDVYYAASSHDHERALLQSNPTNADNRDIAIGANNGIGVSDGFDGVFRAETWQRIALVVDLSGPGPNPVMAKFINGVKVGQQLLSEGRDGRWSLKSATEMDAPWALLFADNDVDVAPGYVSSIQIRSDRLSDELIARLGGPSRHKIPGCIRIQRENGNLAVRWTGGVPLESAENIQGPWSVVTEAVSPYSVSMQQSARFYRPKL